MIGSIIGILLVVGSIVVYKSYAIYEEENRYNIIEGIVPDYGYDVKLAVEVDGE